MAGNENGAAVLAAIQQDIDRFHSMGLLDGLLADRTTRSNILWGTDAYAGLGPDYERDRQIFSALITGGNDGIIRSRAEKAREERSERTRRHGEVFTPLRVCNQMNNYADEIWFGRPDSFNVDGVPTKRVDFPAQGRRKVPLWQRYVDSRRLEITCGEAPYLVSRYDAATGKSIELRNRIGLLDRKLRVVDENTDTESVWLKWALRAFQATYGYESQGDNLLIARLNMLLTYEEYLRARWDREPSRREYGAVINIIAWNLWQMDGLAGRVPYGMAEDERPQLNLFGAPEMEWTGEGADTRPRCRIRDWRRKKTMEYAAVGRGG